MCGIIGYIGWREAIEPIMRGLKRMEYRGYDSAGVAIQNGELSLYKTKGTVSALEGMLPEVRGRVGIGHTRWATHGVPSTENAHPLLDCKSGIAVVHNGIIDNFSAIKEALSSRGHRFTSDTDTEVISHLIEENYDGDLLGALAATVKELEGSYAICAISRGERRVVAARKDSPLVVGVGEREYFLASDIPALLDYTKKVVYVQDNELVAIDHDGYRIMDADLKAVGREVSSVDWSIEDAERGGYGHFMLKEMFEQPSAIHSSLLGRVIDADVYKNGGFVFDNIKIIACGTSYHAGLIGKYIFEDIVSVPTSVEMSSEYRYSAPPYERPLVVLVTQSGETADTIAAAREARSRGCQTIAITNVVGSSITREVDSVIYTRAGIEVGVAATKTFTTQLIALYLLALRLGIDRKTLGWERVSELKRGMRSLPRIVQNVLDDAPLIEEKKAMFNGAHSSFFIGRNINYPVALEGSLKMKEISYVHAEGYPAGELKHGPLALLTEETPVVAIAVRDHTYEKMLGNIREVKARGSPVLVVGYEDDPNLETFADEIIYVPKVDNIFSPVVVSVALQLLAYYVARDRGCSIDKPRNLAKSVTVE